MASLRAADHEAWRKASRSIANGDCVETASKQGEILVRDSKAPAGLALRYSASAWRSFVRDIKRRDPANWCAIDDAGGD
jgi:hypothetical protein